MIKSQSNTITIKKSLAENINVNVTDVLLEYLNRIQSEFRQNFEIKLTQEIKTCLHKFLKHQSWKS